MGRLRLRKEETKKDEEETLLWQNVYPRQPTSSDRNQILHGVVFIGSYL